MSYASYAVDASHQEWLKQELTKTFKTNGYLNGSPLSGDCKSNPEIVMAAKSKSKPNRELSSLTKGYLVAYNLAQVFGWSYLLYLIAKYYLTGPKDVPLWDVVKPIVIIFQNAAVLEILHAATNIVPSNVIITVFQVFSRVIVVCGVLLPTPTGPLSPGLPLALLAWSITEVIRYLYYALNLLGAVPYILIWCRYTTFIVLYPVGVTGELLCFYAAQAYVANTKLWTLEMPNKLNFTFSYHYVLLFLMFLYIPLFPQMYLHMFAQRRKILGGGSSASKKAK